MDPNPDLLVGLVAFSLGLGLFVFPRPVARAAAGALGRPAGHRGTAAVRGTRGLGMALGFALLLT
jgi:hypothetical protein